MDREASLRELPSCVRGTPVALSNVLVAVARQLELTEAEHLLLPCLDASDDTRIEALKRLLREKRRQTPVDDDHNGQSEDFDLIVRRASHLIYERLFNFEVWLEPLRKITFPARLRALGHAEAVALLDACKRVIRLYWDLKHAKRSNGDDDSLPREWVRDARVWDHLPAEHREALCSLVGWMDSSYPHGEPFFVKLSTRSPKDSLVMTARRLAHSAALQSESSGLSETAGFSGEVAPQRRLPKALRGKVSAAFLEASADASRVKPSPNLPASSQDLERETEPFVAMKNENGWEGLDLLLASQRILDDLTREGHAEDAVFSRLGLSGNMRQEDSTGLYLIARPWADIPRSSELRGFIFRRELTALSQYFTAEHFPSLWKAREALAHDAREFVSTQLGPAMPMENAVVDLVWDPHAVGGFTVIELNPFGRSAGSALFNWFDDHDVLFGLKPFECRIREP